MPMTPQELLEKYGFIVVGSDDDYDIGTVVPITFSVAGKLHETTVKIIGPSSAGEYVSYQQERGLWVNTPPNAKYYRAVCE